MNEKLQVVIVSGLSGAGKTVALRALEDSGFFCIDNLPLPLVEPFLSTITSSHSATKIGIGMDIREKQFLSRAYDILTSLKVLYMVEIIFLDAEKEVIIRRYKETRRPHPVIARRQDLSMEHAIDEERESLAAIREMADRVIDTSNFSPHQLRHMIFGLYGKETGSQPITISLISFGYKFGVPNTLDLLFDVRFLPNPHFIADLRPLRGTDPEVIRYVLSHADAKALISHINTFIDFVLPRYIAEGKNYLTIGIGCTGGHHRSPVIVSRIADHIKEEHRLEAAVIHRDLDLK